MLLEFEELGFEFEAILDLLLVLDPVTKFDLSDWLLRLSEDDDPDEWLWALCDECEWWFKFECCCICTSVDILEARNIDQCLDRCEYKKDICRLSGV